MSGASSLLDELQAWYAAQCNDDWEHTYGIEIRSCDNPGWWVTIDLTGTPLEGHSFTPVRQNVDENEFATEDRWLSCSIKEQTWHGAGDETKLPVILSHFLDWAKGQD